MIEAEAAVADMRALCCQVLQSAYPVADCMLPFRFMFNLKQQLCLNKIGEVELSCDKALQAVTL